ncbi:MAG: response regulator transcription factor [Gemmatimonadaceae bacterium]|nr:response regulator transcription factor [Gemmatimonadaceae bacterium]
MRLLVVEDDPKLAALVARGLREDAYAVDVAEDGPRALSQTAMNRYDAIVLDVMLPGLDGFGVVQALRSRGIRTPVLMLTARDAVPDRIMGLDAGADDYLTKPFDFGELLARVRALLRRPEQLQASRVTVADLAIDLNSQAVTRDGESIVLTAKEFALLELLARNVDRIVPRTEIVAHVWDDNHDPFTNAVEVYMNRLRGKIDREPWTPLLHTKRGAGYMLSATAPGAT